MSKQKPGAGRSREGEEAESAQKWYSGARAASSQQRAAVPAAP